MPRRLTDQERAWRSVPESAVLAGSLAYLALRNVYAWRNNSGATKTEAGQFVRFGKPGSADILGIGPDGSGRLLCIECKTETGKLSHEQEVFRDQVVKHGAIYIVVRPSNYQQVIDQALGITD